MSYLPNEVMPGQHNGFSQSGEEERRSFPVSRRRQRGQVRLVALLGADDFHDNAAPCNDGLFDSDFYCFNHVFSKIGNAQKWLTCLSPVYLVEKYGAFTHGDPASNDLLVVLDRKICKEVKRIEVHTLEVLLDNFLTIVRVESRIASEKKQNLLLILCSHGQTDTGSIAVGSQRNPRTELLSLQMVLDAVVEGTQVTIITTGCFSGRWVISPKQNATIFAAASPHLSAWSWPPALDDRISGSQFVRAFVASLMACCEEENENTAMKTLPFRFIGCKTLAFLCATIHQKCRESLTRTESPGSPSFCVRDDAWGLTVSRLGISFFPSRENLGLSRLSSGQSSRNARAS